MMVASGTILGKVVVILIQSPFIINIIIQKVVAGMRENQPDHGSQEIGPVETFVPVGQDTAYTCGDLGHDKILLRWGLFFYQENGIIFLTSF